jgi:hypothetical protein
MHFSSLDDYLNYWYPSAGVTVASQMAKEHNKTEELGRFLFLSFFSLFSSLTLFLFASSRLDFLENFNYDLVSTADNKFKPKCAEAAFSADYAYLSESVLTEADFKKSTHG